LFIFLLVNYFGKSQIKIDSLPYKIVYRKYVQHINVNNSDSAEFYLNQLFQIAKNKGDNFFISQFSLDKAILFYYKNMPEAAKQEALKSYILSKRYQNYNAMLRSENLLGAVAYVQGDFVTSEKWYLEKIREAKLLKDTSQEMSTYYNLGLIYSQTGRYLESAEASFKCIEYFEEKKDTFNLLYQYQSLGSAYINLNDVTSGIKFLFKAAKLCRNVQDNYQLSGLYIDIADAYTKEDSPKYDSAFRYIDKAIKLSKLYNDEFHYAIAIGYKANYFTGINKFPEAVVLLREAIAINKKESRSVALVVNYNIYSGCLLKFNRLDSALYFSKLAYQLAKEQNQKEQIMEGVLTISKVYEKMNQYDSSLKYHQLYFENYKSIQKATQLRGIGKKEFEFEKANQEKLRAQEKQLADVKLEKQKQINTIVIIASALLSILLVISFINYRQKQKASAEILKQKKLLEEKQKEIHDSIVYASRIQKSLMPTTRYLKKKLHENN